MKLDFRTNHQAQSGMVGYYMGMMITVIIVLTVVGPVIDSMINELRLSSSPNSTVSSEFTNKHIFDGFVSVLLGFAIIVFIVIFIGVAIKNRHWIFYNGILPIISMIGDDNIRQRIRNIRDVREWKKNRTKETEVISQ